jgi:hypothetical protein
VASHEHLIALKVLSLDDRRPNDRADLQALLTRASTTQVERADAALALITERGFNRRKDLHAELDQVIALYAPKLDLDRGPTLDR